MMPLGDLTHIPAKVVYLLKNIISSKRDEAKITAIIILQQISRNISIFVDNILESKIIDSIFTFSAPFLKQMDEKSLDDSISEQQLHLTHLLRRT